MVLVLQSTSAMYFTSHSAKAVGVLRRAQCANTGNDCLLARAEPPQQYSLTGTLTSMNNGGATNSYLSVKPKGDNPI